MDSQKTQAELLLEYEERITERMKILSLATPATADEEPHLITWEEARIRSVVIWTGRFPEMSTESIWFLTTLALANDSSEAMENALLKRIQTLLEENESALKENEALKRVFGSVNMHPAKA
ncbi:MAG: hypothetical protein Q7R39_11505 [Dehalococcoidia bacterium]|nr:hypothetical protein [Dehalococcoidia bacterium]